MKIAVLMSVYNGHKYIEKQLMSLANQTVAKNMVLYIRDDGSSDDTLDIIEKWKSRLNIVLFQGDNIGPAMSFLTMLMNTDIQADYYAFCDQDDIWDLDKLECAIMQLNNKVLLYACNCRMINMNGKIINNIRLKKPPHISLNDMFICGCTQGCSMVFTDKLRKQIIKSNLQHIPMHDIVVMAYAFACGDIYWDQLPHFSYRIHENNVVAKEKKSLLKKIQCVLWNWNNGRNNSVSYIAQEMINANILKRMKDKEYIEIVANYKKSFSYKYRLIFDKNLKKYNHNIVMSYRIRVLLNMF